MFNILIQYTLPHKDWKSRPTICEKTEEIRKTETISPALPDYRQATRKNTESPRPV